MPNLLYIDLFCGAGGTSTGVESAKLDGQKCADVIACVNHDTNAIASHAANHPNAMHFTEDIRTLDLTSLTEHTQAQRATNPDALIVLWASLECTNFSNAKGGQPRDGDSRTLANHLFRYIEALDPDYIQIENVKEFMSWGDLDENGKPISKDAGRCYREWIKRVRSYGYSYEYRILNSADYGARTSRRRFFGIFAKGDLLIAFPSQTHSQKPVAGLKPWQPVRDVLDLDNEGESIFTRTKPLSEKTLERIYAGLIKFVAGGKEQWLLKYNSVNGKTGKHIPPSIDEPCPTIACQPRMGLLTADFISRYNGVRPSETAMSLEKPCGVVTTNNRFAKVRVNFLSKQFSGDPYSKNIGVDGPSGAITCVDHHAFISAYYGNGHNHSVATPCPTLTTKDRCSLVTPRFLFMQYGNSSTVSLDESAPTVTTSPKHNLVTIKPWVMNTNFNNIGSSLDEPLGVITANRKWQYILNPQYTSAGGSIETPCFTLIARMDKRPPSLMTATYSDDTLPPFIRSVPGGFIYEIYDTDSKTMVEIKELMAIYGVTNILMRMLQILELLQIMGFDKEYRLIGTKTEMKKYIGNAVEVTMARVLCEALALKINRLRKVA